MKSVEGDLLEFAGEGRFDVIIHGCNCFCTMGAGIAKSIRNQFPAAYEADLATLKGDRDKLGTYSSAKVIVGEHSFDVVNAYTQFHWRSTGVKADYEAIREVFKSIQRDFAGRRIGYPMIGAGLAGGDWDTISEIICEELVGESHTMVVFKP
ncbi:macro domain-containing protein [Allorhodopirellula heiligendammensis]|uniref:Macro domain protein n=1 Tax=Allorhodopirellula heiligendammensis TaxID=2714739 RepID=A0A5C6C305_9BACT|nr:macro domain-containing protein [Allorhodopirellula heiligendammensis]TWU17886.1 Macro domain protein [Allorhodopirellula heiligendammensis]